MLGLHACPTTPGLWVLFIMLDCLTGKPQCLSAPLPLHVFSSSFPHLFFLLFSFMELWLHTRFFGGHWDQRRVRKVTQPWVSTLGYTATKSLKEQASPRGPTSPPGSYYHFGLTAVCDKIGPAHPGRLSMILVSPAGSRQSPFPSCDNLKCSQTGKCLEGKQKYSKEWLGTVTWMEALTRSQMLPLDALP